MSRILLPLVACVLGLGALAAPAAHAAAPGRTAPVVTAAPSGSAGPTGTLVVESGDGGLWSWRLGDAQALPDRYLDDDTEETPGPHVDPDTRYPTPDRDVELASLSTGDEQQVVALPTGNRAAPDGTAPGARVIATVPTSECAEQDALDELPDGSAVLMACRTDGSSDSLLRIDLPFVDAATSVHDVSPTLPDGYDGAWFQGMSVSADDRLLSFSAHQGTCSASQGYLTNDCYRLMVAPLAGGAPASPVRFAGQPVKDAGAGTFSPSDPGLLAYSYTPYSHAGPGPGLTRVVRLATGATTTVAGFAELDEQLTWSPDGTHVAWLASPGVSGFPSGTPSTGEYAVMAPVDGSSAPTVVTPLPPDTPANVTYYGRSGPTSASRLRWYADSATDVGVTTTVQAPSGAVDGTPFDVTVTVANAGPATATGVSVDLTPSVLTSASDLDPRLVAATGATCTQHDAEHLDTRTTRRFDHCVLPDLAPGASESLTATFVSGIFGTFTFRAAERDDQTDRRLGAEAMTQAVVAVGDGAPDPTVDGRIVYQRDSSCDAVGDPSTTRTYDVDAVDPDGGDPVVLAQLPCGESGGAVVRAGYLWWSVRDPATGATAIERTSIAAPGPPQTIVDDAFPAGAGDSAVAPVWLVSPDGSWLYITSHTAGSWASYVPVADPSTSYPVGYPPADDGVSFAPADWTDHGTTFLSDSQGLTVVGTDGTIERQGPPPPNRTDAVTGPYLEQNLLPSSDGSSVQVFGGYGAGTFPPLRSGDWRLGLAPTYGVSGTPKPDASGASTLGPAGTATFLGASDTSSTPGVVSPAGDEVVYVDPNVDHGREAERLEIRDVATTAPYESGGASIALPGPETPDVRVIGWSDVPAVGGVSTARPVRVPAPVLEPGVRAAGVRPLAPAESEATGIVGASANLATEIELGGSPESYVVRSTLRSTPLSVAFGTAPIAISPDGRYLAISVINGVAVIDVATGRHLRLPATSYVDGTTFRPTSLHDGVHSGTFAGAGDARLMFALEDGRLLSVDWSAAHPVWREQRVADPADQSRDGYDRLRGVISPSGDYVAWDDDASSSAAGLTLAHVDATGAVTTTRHVGVGTVEVQQLADDGRAVVAAPGYEPQPEERVVDPGRTTDQGTLLAAYGTPGMSLSPDGTQAWLSTTGGSPSDPSDDADPCAGLALVTLSTGAQTCVSRDRPYQVDRAALDVAPVAGDDGLAYAVTVEHQDGGTDALAGTQQVLVALVGVGRSLTRVPLPTGRPVVTTPSRGRAVLTWSLPVATPDAPRTAVLVRYRGRVLTLPPTTTSRTFSGQRKGATYAFAVATRGPGGTSAWTTVTEHRHRS